MRGDVTFSKNFRITERYAFQYRLEIFNVFSLWHSALNGGPNGGGGIQGNLASSNFGSLVPIQHDPISGDPSPDNLQAGTRYLWNPRTIQMTAKFTF